MGSSSRSTPAIARLWQLPLFLLSLGLFGFAAYLFIDPKPGLTIEQKIARAQTYLKYDRPEAAIDELNKLFGGERLTLENEAKVHVLLAQSIEEAAKLKKLDLPANHERIIEQSRIAISQGVKPDADIYRRMGESYEALGQPAEALKNYRRAEAMDENRSLRLKRKVIELQIAQGDAGAAGASLDEYLNDEKLSDSERAWALGEQSHLLADAGQFIEARGLLGKALELNPDPTAQGQLHYWLGYCQWKLGDPTEAERLLRVARDLMKVRHPTDADAAYALGRIRHEKGDYKEAAAFYESVLVSHPDAPAAVLAKLGRGVGRVALGQDEAGLNDLGTLVNDVVNKPAKKKRFPEIIAGLREAAGVLSARANYEGALEVMAYEQTLAPVPEPEFFARLADLYAKRSEQVDATVASAANEEEQFRRTAQARDLRTKAGDAHLAFAKGLAGKGSGDDDRAYGESIWRAVDLYDRAGSLPLAIAALELFVNERPDDGLAPDAMLRLGRAYQAAGDFDKAIAALQRNQFRYPNSLAASKSGVPLAQAYIAKGGPDADRKAERVLKAVVENNPLITPEAEEFRQALFELAQLYYRLERFEESVARLEEINNRYADDQRVPQMLFLMADSYRKSAGLLRQGMADKDQLKLADAKGGTVATAAASRTKDLEAATARAAAEKAQGEAAMKDRLTRAGRLYAQVIEHFRQVGPQADLDKLYLKLSHFYRADCLYDLGDYRNAIKHYDIAASRYQDDPAALAAWVQIVNAYCALGKLDDARAANERAKVMLRGMSADSFENAAGGFPMSKQYWEQWLKWTNDAGMFGDGDPALAARAGAILSSGQESVPDGQ